MHRRAALIMTIGAAMMAGCASSQAVPRPLPGAPLPPAATPPPALPPPVAGEESAAVIAPPVATSTVVSTALSFLGVPYRNGGTDPSGFDCSGFVAYVFAQQGLYMPRTVSEQYGQGQPVGPDAVAPGDLVFFSTVAPGASHVGIAISQQQFVHAPSSSGVVRVESLAASYWSSRFVGTRRIP